MDQAWILLSVGAALMQAVRTAAQRQLNRTISTMGTTYVRSLFGVPLMALYLVLVMRWTGEGVPRFSVHYLTDCFLGGLTQVLATACLIYLLRLRNFAVGTTLTKADVVMTAIIGSLFFAEVITPLGWIALGLVLVGMALLSLGRAGVAALTGEGGGFLGAVLSRPTQIGLLTGLLFTFSYLFLRDATLAMGGGTSAWRGAWTVFMTTLMQAIFLGIWLIIAEPAVFRQLWPNRWIISFIAITSTLGSIGWFTAFALQNASYVRSVGQIEAVFTLSISYFYFREKVNALELAGIVVTVGAVLLFRLL